MELINCLMLTVCNRISLDSIWHIQIYCLGVDIYSCIVIVIHCFDNSDMTSPNSLIFFLFWCAYPSDIPALERVEFILFFLNYVEIKKTKVMCERGNKMVYSCQPVSLSNPLSSSLLNLQYKKYCLLSDSLFPSA